MKLTLLKILTWIVGVCTFLAGLGSYVDFLPKDWAAIAALVLPVMAALTALCVKIGDKIDDGLPNGSFPFHRLIVWWAIPFLCVSCATTAAGEKTFLGLGKGQWSVVGLDIGKGAVAAAVPAYLGQRRALGKEVIIVHPPSGK